MLLLALHGVGNSGAGISLAWSLPAIAGPNLIILTPDGSKNAEAQRSWNASTACCNDLASPPDDVSTLVALVQNAIVANGIDPRYVFVAGDSNGGFMAWRLICTHADLFAAAAIVSGSANTPNDPPCTPSRHVPILHVHGTSDPVVMYQACRFIGTTMRDCAPAPIGVGGAWAQEAAFNGCAGGLQMIRGFAYDHDATTWNRNNPVNNYGAETDVIAFGGCPADGPVEIWRMLGSMHDIPWSASWAPDLIAWLVAHHR